MSISSKLCPQHTKRVIETKDKLWVHLHKIRPIQYKVYYTSILVLASNKYNRKKKHTHTHTHTRIYIKEEEEERG